MRMGMDQYLHAFKGEDFIEIGCWRNEHKFNSVIHGVWVNRGKPGDAPEDGFNGVSVILTLNDLKMLIELAQDRKLHEHEDGKDYFYGKTINILEVAIEMVCNGWEMSYHNNY